MVVNRVVVKLLVAALTGSQPVGGNNHSLEPYSTIQYNKGGSRGW